MRQHNPLSEPRRPRAIRQIRQILRPQHAPGAGRHCRGHQLRVVLVALGGVFEEDYAVGGDVGFLGGEEGDGEEGGDCDYGFGGAVEELVQEFLFCVCWIRGTHLRTSVPEQTALQHPPKRTTKPRGKAQETGGIPTPKA